MQQLHGIALHNVSLPESIGDLAQSIAALAAGSAQRRSPHNVRLAQDVGHLALSVKQPHTVHDGAAVLAAMHRLGLLGEQEACRVFPQGLSAEQLYMSSSAELEQHAAGLCSPPSCVEAPMRVVGPSTALAGACSRSFTKLPEMWPAGAEQGAGPACR